MPINHFAAGPTALPGGTQFWKTDDRFDGFSNFLGKADRFILFRNP
jgi:hypothetical protein